jgi:hypothetical protein
MNYTIDVSVQQQNIGFRTHLCAIPLLKGNAILAFKWGDCVGGGAICYPVAQAKVKVPAALGNGQASGSLN